VGNCGLYAGPWGVRVEDTSWVKPDGFETLTEFERVLVG
jgi:Xaa-Pro aminopeptidase